MKKNFIWGLSLIAVVLMGLTTISCKSEAQRLKEAEEKIEKDLQESNEKAWQEWLKTERLIEKATGVTSHVTDERMDALLRFMEKYPYNKHLDGIKSSIDRKETYENWEEMIYELKKEEGWREE